MAKTSEDFNKEINLLALRLLEKQWLVRDLRKAIETENGELVKLIEKAGKIRDSFREFLDNNPDEKRKFLGQKAEEVLKEVPEEITESAPATEIPNA